MSTTSIQNTSESKVDLKKIGDMIKDIRIAMLSTVDKDGVVRSRPMATQEVEFDGDIWFFTGQETDKVGDINHYPQVNVAYVSTGDERYVSMMGSADIVNDAFKKKELWKPIMKAWFPLGLDDPDLRLIKVNVTQAEYWEASGGKVGSVLGIVKNLVTGTTGAEGKNEKVIL